MNPKYFGAGSAVSADSHVYITRDLDDRLPKILMQGQPCCLYAGRQFGKTSLMYSTMYKIQEEKCRLCIDQSIYVIIPRTPSGKDVIDTSYVIDRLIEKLSKKFTENCPKFSKPAYDSEKTPGENLAGYLTALYDFLKSSESQYKQLVIMLDEFDSLLRCRGEDIADILYNLKDFCDSTPKKTLIVNFLLVGARSVSQMIMDFDAGGLSPTFLENIHLSFFENNKRTVSSIIEQGFPDKNQLKLPNLVSKVLKFTSGQPILTCLVFRELTYAENMNDCFNSIIKCCQNGHLKISEEHIGAIRQQLLDSSNLIHMLQVLKRIREEQSDIDSSEIAVQMLTGLGLIRKIKKGYCIANKIYEAQLGEAWMNELEDDWARKTMRRSKIYFDNKIRRIGIIFVGGTAGMIMDKTKTTFNGAKEVFDKFLADDLTSGKRIVEKISWDVLDGINVTPYRWLSLVREIHENLNKYDGIVVVHGTDTMAFTASAIAFMLGPKLDTPVIFTGAQTTIDFIYGDTRTNISRACFVAGHKDTAKEVQILFGDYVFRAVRAEKKDDRLFTDGFHSPGWPPLARVTQTLLVNEYAFAGRTFYKENQKVETPYEAFKNMNGGYSPYFAKEVIIIPIVPGLLPKRYMTLMEESRNGEKLDGIILTTPGVGNIPNIVPYNFRPAIQMAKDMGIPVLVSSQVPINPETQEEYEMASVPQDYGAILTGNITFAAAMTKFSWVIGCINENFKFKNISSEERIKEIKKWMKINYIGEQG